MAAHSFDRPVTRVRLTMDDGTEWDFTRGQWGPPDNAWRVDSTIGDGVMAEVGISPPMRDADVLMAIACAMAAADRVLDRDAERNL